MDRPAKMQKTVQVNPNTIIFDEDATKLAETQHYTEKKRSRNFSMTKQQEDSGGGGGGQGRDA